MYEVTTYQPVDYSLDSLFFTLLFSLIQACIFGAITHAINDAKGYDGGFWWGFFLGVIGIIVVAVRQPYYTLGYNTNSDGIIRSGRSRTKPIDPNEPVPEGGWHCSCGRVHEAYESSCSCGLDKHGAKKAFAKTLSEKLPTPPTNPQDWVCTCGKEHLSYETSCICGMTKHQVLTANIVLPEPIPEPEPAPAPVPETEPLSDDENIQQLRKYKALLDEGVITQDDYDAKKKQLLGI